jgi:hypothetical protein
VLNPKENQVLCNIPANGINAARSARVVEKIQGRISGREGKFEELFDLEERLKDSIIILRTKEHEDLIQSPGLDDL